VSRVSTAVPPFAHLSDSELCRHLTETAVDLFGILRGWVSRHFLYGVPLSIGTPSVRSLVLPADAAFTVAFRRDWKAGDEGARWERLFLQQEKQLRQRFMVTLVSTVDRLAYRRSVSVDFLSFADLSAFRPFLPRTCPDASCVLCSFIFGGDPALS